ncbi:hypothetical protein GCM10029992_08450 [Glycomyces albus]
MLANRADVWNLGDVLSGRDEVFAHSYIENALTSNPVTAPLAGRERGDVRLLVRLASGDPTANPDDLVHAYSAGELDQVLSVLRKMVHIQRTVLGNNMAYIGSAATDDAARTEPPFLLQGSYRNMNRLAERVVPVMNDEELEAVIDDHYAGEAQTLASGAEANLLKLAELRGRLTEDQAERWEAVKEAFRRRSSSAAPRTTRCPERSARSRCSPTGSAASRAPCATAATNRGDPVEGKPGPHRRLHCTVVRRKEGGEEPVATRAGSGPDRQVRLSRDRVLRAAVAIADERGLAALTMRGLAESLGVEAMSLYHHVAGKEAVLDGLVDVVMAEIEADVAAIDGPDPADDWKAAIRARILTAREVLLRHPGRPACSNPTEARRCRWRATTTACSG